MRKLIDLADQRFGALTALAYMGDGQWQCRCECGRTKLILGDNLRRGRVKTCGSCGTLKAGSGHPNLLTTLQVLYGGTLDYLAKAGWPRSTVLVYWHPYRSPVGGASRQLDRRGVGVWYDAGGKVLVVTSVMVARGSATRDTGLESVVMDSLLRAGHMPHRALRQKLDSWLLVCNVTLSSHQVSASADHTGMEALDATLAGLGLSIPTRAEYLNQLASLPKCGPRPNAPIAHPTPAEKPTAETATIEDDDDAIWA